MAEPKTKPTGKSVNAFLNAIADPVRRADCFEVVEMMQDATGEKPQMWGPSIVGFGRHYYKSASGGGADWPMIGFSPRKTALTLYIMSGMATLPELMEKLGKHKTSKACLYIKKLSDVDRKVLKKLINKSVKELTRKRVNS